MVTGPTVSALSPITASASPDWAMASFASANANAAWARRASVVTLAPVRFPALRAELGRAVGLGAAVRTFPLRTHARATLRTELATLCLGPALWTERRDHLGEVALSEEVHVAHFLGHLLSGGLGLGGGNFFVQIGRARLAQSGLLV